MAYNLKYGVGGNLLYGPTGQMVYDCGEVACNDCDPAIPAQMCVTLEGMAGDFAGDDGTWEVHWTSGCEWWGLTASHHHVVVNYDDDTGSWYASIFLSPLSNCGKGWKQTTDACSPYGTYAEDVCLDSACTDHDTCEASSGAACIVGECPDKDRKSVV